MALKVINDTRFGPRMRENRSDKKASGDTQEADTEMRHEDNADLLPNSHRND